VGSGGDAGNPAQTGGLQPASAYTRLAGFDRAPSRDWQVAPVPARHDERGLRLSDLAMGGCSGALRLLLGGSGGASSKPGPTARVHVYRPASNDVVGGGGGNVLAVEGGRPTNSRLKP